MLRYKTLLQLFMKTSSSQRMAEGEKDSVYLQLYWPNPSVELVEETQKWQTTLPAPICPKLQIWGKQGSRPSSGHIQSPNGTTALDKYHYITR